MVSTEFSKQDLGSGIVLVSHGNRGRVKTLHGQEIDVHYRRGVGRPVCGDLVELEDNHDGTAVVTEISERTNVFARADHRQRKQVIAANLDQVLIVLATQPAPSRDLLERYLVAAHGLGIKPVIVVNKTDLDGSNQPQQDTPFSRLADYTGLGYKVIKSSCKGNPGTDALREVLGGRMSILAGQSGVGKSSLVNQLVPDLDIQTGALSDSTGKGRHTTTSTMMYQLPQVSGESGYLVDSPGVWEYGLWQLERAELETGFIEFRPFLGECRFNDCLHDSEPGCAVKAAVESGQISEWRYQSYCRLLHEQ
ncbi:MAG TPA: ribosome small subunit-dependent GTPase A [Xanthomonadales bacterium]|nr:ribosome small subunit-dependent GTPase A [Xanthomonadales bacterium]